MIVSYVAKCPGDCPLLAVWLDQTPSQVEMATRPDWDMEDWDFHSPKSRKPGWLVVTVVEDFLDDCWDLPRMWK